jgi:hypothetical protein
MRAFLAIGANEKLRATMPGQPHLPALAGECIGRGRFWCGVRLQTELLQRRRLIGTGAGDANAEIAAVSPAGLIVSPLPNWIAIASGECTPRLRAGILVQRNGCTVLPVPELRVNPHAQIGKNPPTD